MLHEDLLILAIIGSMVCTYIPITNAYGICSCLCCDGRGCDPIPQGIIEISSCDGLYCITACKNEFPLSCSNVGTYEVDGSCREFAMSTTMTSSISSSIASTTYSTTTYSYGICSCSCCNGDGCVPTYQGYIQISSCDGQICNMACQKRFPWTCGSSGSHEIDAKCTEVVPTTTTTPSTTTFTVSSTITSIYGICSCSCCNGEGCTPTYQGNFEIQTCDGQYCVMACQNNFPSTCGSSGTHEIDAKCSQIMPSTTTSTISTTTSIATTTATTTTYAICSCFCCRGEACVPTDQGDIPIPSCDGQNCIVTCQNTFPRTCGSSGTHEVDAKCRQNPPSTTYSTTSTMVSTTTASISTTTSSEPTSTTSSATITTTYAYGICSCFCCSGERCDPGFQGNVEVPSCDGLNCITACKNRFPLSCNSAEIHEVEGNCKEWSRQQLN